MTNEKLEVLIKWKDLPDCENTWEDYETINTEFPQFHLEDKVKLVGEGNDGPPIIHQYNRRGRQKK